MLIRYDAIKVVDIMNRIKVLRLERNIKQVDLAKAVSVSQAALSGYETGKYEPDFDTLKRIAEYFDVSIDYLLGGKLDSRDNVSATEDDIKAAFWGGDKDLSAEDMGAMWADVKNFAAFVAQKKKQEKTNINTVMDGVQTKQKSQQHGQKQQAKQK